MEAASSRSKSPGSLDVLPAIKEAVGGRLTVMLDSGIRRGTDILIALCLGADFCFMGRPTLYGAPPPAAIPAGQLAVLDPARGNRPR